MTPHPHNEEDFDVSARLDELRGIQDDELYLEQEPAPQKLVLPEWKRKNLLVGNMLFVKRKLWKDADGFSYNKKKKGHPGVVTIDSSKGSRTVMLVPGTSTQPRENSNYFQPKGKITYTKSSFRQKNTLH